MLLQSIKPFLSVIAAGIIASSCTALPSSGPSTQAVENQAAVKVTTEGKKVGIDYVLVDITKGILNFFEMPKIESLSGGFGGGKGGAPTIPLGIGDTIQVSIFEAQSGGLFIPTDAGSRPGNYITLPSQTIDQDGTLTVPYAGRLKAAGRVKEQVEQEIENLLANRAIEPQALITVVNRNSSQVSVLGDVNSPQRISLSNNGERVLDAISLAGGITDAPADTYVTLTRGNRTSSVSYNKLISTPSENIYLAPKDTLLVQSQRRTYVALGAAGVNSRINFENDNLSLSDALGKAGGIVDNRANPSQVLLYRSVDRKVLDQMGVDTHNFTGDTIPVVFRANLRDPSAFFAIQKFPMMDRDILFVTNSDSVEVVKFLSYVNSVTSTVSGASSDIVTTRDAYRALGD